VASLKDPGAILFISCYELGHQPLAVASAAAVLRRAGFQPAALDLARQAVDTAAAERARLIAIAVPMHTALRLGVIAAARLRALNPGAHLAFYGLYATLNAGTLFAAGAGSVIGGECEEPLLRLAAALERGQDGPIPGVRTPAHAAGPWIAKVSLEVPARDLLPPLDGYVRLIAGGESRVTGHVEASRGCLHLCRHCPIPPVYGGRFFVVPRAIVLEDIARQVAQGARHITFGDPDFLNGPGHALAIARDLHARFPAVSFDFTAKVEHLLRHRGHLSGMAGLGCLFIVTAAESLSDRVLGILAKGHTRTDVETALGLARGAGITLRPTWVPFTPWTSLDDYIALLDFIEDRDLIDAVDPVQMSIRLLVPPGSLLESHQAFLPHRGALDAQRFTWTWKHPDPRMDVLHAEVSTIVERAAGPGEEAGLTFTRVRDAAQRAAGASSARKSNARTLSARDVARRALSLPTRAVPPPPVALAKGRPPRLSEPWFC
jgi:radical SAM superfamily enzyme YgiQ (UPF0313 family)